MEMWPYECNFKRGNTMIVLNMYLRLLKGNVDIFKCDVCFHGSK